MKLSRLILALAACLGLPACVSAPDNDGPPPTALVGATIIDGDGGAPIPDGVVILRGDRIEAVGPRSTIAIPANAERIDLTGKWITPGLIDAHVHFFQSGGLYTRPDSVDLRTVRPYADDLGWSKSHLDETFRRYLASGVTSVVDAGGPLWNFDVREAAAKSSAAPRVAVAGPLIATEPTQPQQRMNLGDPPIISAATPEEAADLARKLLPHKPDLIKIWGIGQGLEGAARVKAITQAVAAVAHPAGVRVAVHATELELARAALEGGADVLAHSVEDAPVDPAFIALAKQRNAVYMTTLMVYEGYNDAFKAAPSLSAFERRFGSPDIIATLTQAPEAYRGVAIPLPLAIANPNAVKMREAGVRVAAGTDAGNIGTLHGPALHRELELLVAAGFTPGQALTAATRDAAYAFSPAPDIGLIKPGYRADLLVLDADPLDSIANLQRIDQVWSRGVAHKPGALIPSPEAALVQRQLEAYNAHDVDAFLATYSPDIELFDLPDTAKPMMKGIPEMHQRYGRLFAQLPKLRCRIGERIVEGPFVIDHEICDTGMPGEPEMRAVAIYQVENNLIRRVWFAANE
jgi:imidazolonepropionase-like amidohydrolase